MKIVQSNVSLGASRAYREELTRRESLRVTIDGATVSEELSGKASMDPEELADVVRISERAAMLGRQRPAPVPMASAVDPGQAPEADTEAGLDPRYATMRRILELLTGKKIRIGDLREVRGQDQPASISVPSAGGPEASGEPQTAGWGLAYDFQEQYHEQEETSFAAAGRIVTDNGQDIAFRLDMRMAREYAESTAISIRAGDAALTDPLVVNFAGPAVALSEARFAFDLDSDGRTERIPLLMPGSGYLAMDRNRDGLINNGSELFGPATGSGFAELGRYDRDGNGWLDENDPAFVDLRIWIREADGIDSLFTLDEKRVAALLLDSARTEFSQKDGDNALLGKIVRTGLYLAPDGEAGTVQELDLTS